jgi:putative methyltransferase (TIGR04325 family)
MAGPPAPRVSVILPSYNHASYVVQAVESVLSQSFGDLELIVTDDGSTDGTADKIRSVSDPRLYLEVLPANRGYSSALNASIARARGEMIALHCSDDAFLPGKLERQVAFLDANPDIAAVFGKPMFVDMEGQPCPPGSHPFDGIFIDDLPDRFAWLRRFFLHGNGLCHPTALVRRAVFDEVGEYDPLLVQLQDFDFWVRVCSRYEIRVLNEPLVAYRVLEGQNTSWPTAEAVRRTTWETRRVLRRFLAFDSELIMPAFGTDFAELGLKPDLSPRAALGLLLAARGEDPGRQVFALELLEGAAAQGDPGVDHFMFSQLTGELDPFNLRLREAEKQAVERFHAAERRAAAAEARGNKLEQSAAAAEDRANAAEARSNELNQRAASAEDRANAAEARSNERDQRAAAAEDRANVAEARSNALDQRAAAAEALAHAVTSSTIWRSTTPLRRLVGSRPAVRTAVRWVLSLARRSAAAMSPQEDARTRREGNSIERYGASSSDSPLHEAGAAENKPSGPMDGRSDPSPVEHVLPAPAPPFVLPEAEPAAAEPVAAVQLRPEWEYVPEGLPPNDSSATGWDHPSVIETQRRKWPEFVRAIQSTNPLGVYHEAAHIESENPAAHNFVLAFAYVLARAAVGRRSLSVLDWGGGLGHYAVIARATLPEVSIEYTVFDLPGICAAGQVGLPDVRFTSDVEECLSRPYDLILASSSLQYATDWRGLLRRFAASATDWIFLSRTPFVDRSPSFVVVQRPHSAGGYQTEYFSHVFNRAELLAEVAAAGLVLEREFLMIIERVAAVGAPEPFEYRGFLLSAGKDEAADGGWRKQADEGVVMQPLALVAGHLREGPVHLSSGDMK